MPANRIPPGRSLVRPEMLPLGDLTPSDIERIVAAVPGGVDNVQDIYPLSPLQEGMLFHHLLDTRRGDTYMLLILLSVATSEALDKLIAAFEAVMKRHDILRTAVLWDGLSGPVQVVYRHATLPVEELIVDPD